MGLLKDFDIHSLPLTPLYAYNLNANLIVANSVYHGSTKHNEVDCHFIPDVYQEGIIALPQVCNSQIFLSRL